ncbi:uncharacterized protein FIESC28_09155 [Fusarium coffeatum]|uniref:Copper-fist domain-containing protein n=1 Tax=Fusarium coffeatum TaxID=231269 RepID=A0A366R2B9_9HYPO|nr:uncharacterized protein FIESC28_09155 [Fusarium coffeatum]RBR11271.1 hypothetical protein FIESC28_09155 [Fusarium coffeatum]
MALKVQKDANGNTVCRRDGQGRKIACAKCIKGHRTSMCKPSHTEDVQVIDSVGRKQGTKNRRRNGRAATYRAESLLQQASQQPLGSNGGNGSASLQSIPQMQAAFPSGESTPQYAQGLQFPPQVQPQPNWAAPIAGTRVPVPQMQANQPAGYLGAAPAQQQQGEMGQQLAEFGIWHDPMHQMQAYQPFGYPEPNYDQLIQMQEPQQFVDIQGRGFMAEGQWAPQPLDQRSGATMNGVPLHQNMAQSQHPVPAQPPIVDWNLADPDQFNKRFPLTPGTLARGTSVLQEPRQERGLQ